jgi:hypothetical protein
MNADISTEPAAGVPHDGDAGIAETDGERQAHVALLEEASIATLPGDLSPGNEELAPNTFLSLMGIDLESRQPDAGEEFAIAADDPVVDDEPDASSRAPRERTAPDPALLQQVYGDDVKAATRRLQRLQAKHDQLIERVARGLTESSELAKSRVALRAAKDAIEDAVALRDHALTVAKERAVRSKAVAFHRAIDVCATELEAAAEDAATIDRLASELGEAVARFRGQLTSIDGLRRQAFSFGGRRVLEALERWLAAPSGLELELVNRLKAEGVLTDGGVRQAQAHPGYVRDRRVLEWAATFGTELIAAARQRAPVLEQDDEGDDDDQ